MKKSTAQTGLMKSKVLKPSVTIYRSDVVAFFRKEAVAHRNMTARYLQANDLKSALESDIESLQAATYADIFEEGVEE